MRYEEIMNQSRQFISEVGITDEHEKYEKDNTLIFVEDVEQVIKAYAEDLENDFHKDEEDVYGFLDRVSVPVKGSFVVNTNDILKNYKGIVSVPVKGSFVVNQRIKAQSKG
jgi:hypothetical protein